MFIKKWLAGSVQHKIKLVKLNSNNSQYKCISASGE